MLQSMAVIYPRRDAHPAKSLKIHSIFDQDHIRFTDPPSYPTAAQSIAFIYFFLCITTTASVGTLPASKVSKTFSYNTSTQVSRI